MRGRDRSPTPERGAKRRRKGNQTRANMERLQAVFIHIYTGGGVGGGMKRVAEEL